MSSVNSAQLAALLELPCVMPDSSQSLFDLPILASAERFGTCEFLQTVMMDESLADFLRRVYNGAKTYTMDCSIYAQLVSIVIGNKWPIDGGYIFLYFVNENAHHFWSTKIPELGYITSSNPEVATELLTFPTNAKGQWAVRVGKNDFLGLGNQGPALMTVEQWIMELRAELKEFAKYHLTVSVFALSHKELYRFAGSGVVHSWFHLDKLNDWGFYTQRGYAAITVKVTGDSYVTKENETSSPPPPSDDLSKIYPYILQSGWIKPKPEEGISGTTSSMNIDGKEYMLYSPIRTLEECIRTLDERIRTFDEHIQTQPKHLFESVSESSFKDISTCTTRQARSPQGAAQTAS